MVRLESCRQIEKPESVLLLAQDNHLVRLLLAWEKIPIQRSRRLSALPSDANDRRIWDWLWENVSYGLGDLAAVSGLSPEVVERHLAVLRGNRLIYPDGTLNKFVAQYLKAKVWRMFQTKAGGAARISKGIAKSQND